MKKFFLIILTYLVLFSVGNQVFGQEKKIEKADGYLEHGEYKTALDLYTKIFAKLKDRTLRGEISYKAGLAARGMQNLNLQLSWFRRATAYKVQEPKAYLYLAEAFLTKGDYENATNYFNQYLEKVPGDEEAERGLKSCELAPKWIEKPSRYTVDAVRIINSRQDDFAPSFSDDTSTLYFTSSRTSGKGTKINPSTGQAFSDLYYAVIDKKGYWKTPVPVAGDINTNFDEGSACITPNGQMIFFTRCVPSKQKRGNCKIFTAKLDNNKWVDVQELKLFEDSLVSCGHPFISPDALTLYFVSDNPKGKGGKDIWYVKRNSPNSDKWSKPQPLSALNTPKDEIFPSVDKDGNIYFSTNGRVGMGGFDIFKACKKKDGTWKIENMKYPINSSANDFRLIVNPYNPSRGYFSSNRVSYKGDDIYWFYLKPLTIILKGYVINDVNHAYLADVDVDITGSDGSKIKAKTDDVGMFKVKLRENVDYIIITSKKYFLKATASVSTRGVEEDGKVFETRLYMKPAVGRVRIPNIRYDFNDTTLREESKVALNELIDLLELNPNVKIELLANTDYRGSEADNLKLSQGRANSVVEYLVEHGISRDRLVPKGLGESSPLKVDKLTAEKYPFLKEGDVLTEQFIKSLPDEKEQEICNELNRRTEFRVISQEYNKNYEEFGSN